MDSKIKSQNVWVDIRMQDTTREAKEAQKRIWQKFTPEQRLMFSLEMMDMAREQIRENIKRSRPGISEIDLKIETIRQMYKDDFNDEQFNEISLWMHNANAAK